MPFSWKTPKIKGRWRVEVYIYMFFGCNWKWFEHWFSVESDVHTCIQWKRDSFQYSLKSRLWIQYKFSSSFLFQVEATSPSVLAGETNQTLPSWWCWRGCWGCWHSNRVLFTFLQPLWKKDVAYPPWLTPSISAMVHVYCTPIQHVLFLLYIT